MAPVLQVWRANNASASSASSLHQLELLDNNNMGNGTGMAAAYGQDAGQQRAAVISASSSRMAPEEFMDTANCTYRYGWLTNAFELFYNNKKIENN
jgi:hypothetical protein